MQSSGGGYPIEMAVPQERELNRWWGLLWFGMLARVILAIPHLIFVMVLGIVLYVGMIVVWIPILIFGRVPGLWNTIATELLKRSTRVSAYVYLFPGGYPALGMGATGPVDLQVNLGDTSINRLWGIPFIGVLVRLIVLFPHWLILSALGGVMSVITFLVWFPILMNGKYPDIAMRFAVMYLRYQARILAYALLMPVRYPPFSFEM